MEPTVDTQPPKVRLDRGWVVIEGTATLFGGYGRQNQQIDYAATVNIAGLQSLARKAHHNRRQYSDDGPIRVTVGKPSSQS